MEGAFMPAAILVCACLLASWAMLSTGLDDSLHGPASGSMRLWGVSVWRALAPPARAAAASTAPGAMMAACATLVTAFFVALHAIVGVGQHFMLSGGTVMAVVRADPWRTLAPCKRQSKQRARAAPSILWKVLRMWAMSIYVGEGESVLFDSTYGWTW